MSEEEAESGAPSPETIYARTKEEGQRRLSRPFMELVSTGFAAGADIVFGVIALGVMASAIASRFGSEVGHIAGAFGFGIAFIFIVVGRSELFTENFLVPIAGLDHRSRGSWYKLVELWTVSPIFNLVGGGLLGLVVTTKGVLPFGTGHALVEVATKIVERSNLAAFMSAIAAGALITVMTWFVEGSKSMGVRIAVAWVCGVLLALGAFNHVIVVTIELFLGIRYGGPISWGDLVQNFFIAAAGNMVGGFGFVTLNRFNQARSGNGGD